MLIWRHLHCILIVQSKWTCTFINYYKSPILNLRLLIKLGSSWEINIQMAYNIFSFTSYYLINSQMKTVLKWQINIDKTIKIDTTMIWKTYKESLSEGRGLRGCDGEADTKGPRINRQQRGMAEATACVGSSFRGRLIGEASHGCIWQTLIPMNLLYLSISISRFSTFPWLVFAVGKITVPQNCKGILLLLK